MQQTFEDYLQDVHAKHYSGTDDDMSEECETWLSEIDVQDIMDYAEIYGRSQFTEGKKYMLNEIKKIR